MFWHYFVYKRLLLNTLWLWGRTLSCIVRRTLYVVYCMAYIVRRILYDVQCTPYTVQCTLCNVHCIIIIVQCTSYTVRRILFYSLYTRIYMRVYRWVHMRVYRDTSLGTLLLQRVRRTASTPYSEYAVQCPLPSLPCDHAFPRWPTCKGCPWIWAEPTVPWASTKCTNSTELSWPASKPRTSGAIWCLRWCWPRKRLDIECRVTMVTGQVGEVGGVGIPLRVGDTSYSTSRGAWQCTVYTYAI